MPNTREITPEIKAERQRLAADMRARKEAQNEKEHGQCFALLGTKRDVFSRNAVISSYCPIHDQYFHIFPLMGELEEYHRRRKEGLLN